jgi:ADP-heptose:LPS heptosyltransferase
VHDPSKLRVVLINPNAGDLLPQRRWMPSRFVELMRRILAAHDDVLVLITGATQERVQAEKLAAQCLSDRCVSIAGFLALADLPGLFSFATVMVTNDSGPAHFAAASGLPTIVLFGPETPNLYRPLGNSTAIYAAVYPFRFYVESGGLVSYGIDQLETVREAPSGAVTDKIQPGGEPEDREGAWSSRPGIFPFVR